MRNDIEFDPRLHHRILYELRDEQGVMIKSGETAGSRDWIDHATYGAQNVIKRVKSALGMRWGVKTSAIPSADGAVRRRFDDGRVLTVWVMRRDTTETTPPITDTRAAVPASIARAVADAEFTVEQAVSILAGMGVHVTTGAVEDAADLISMGVYECDG